MLIHYRALTFSVDMRLNKPQKICLERRAKELDDFSDPGIGSKSSYIGRQLFIFFFLKGLESPWQLRQWRVRLQYGRPRCTPGEESPGEATHLGMATREWLPTAVFLPGEFYGQRSLEGYSPWGRK